MSNPLARALPWLVGSSGPKTDYCREPKYRTIGRHQRTTFIPMGTRERGASASYSRLGTCMTSRSTNETAVSWLAEGRRVVAATLVGTDGSAPLDPGATMLVDDQGRIEGSVTGGCVEGALFEEATAVLDHQPPRFRTYGISESLATGVGLTCGGTVHIFVHEIRPQDRDTLAQVERAVAEGRPAVVAALIDGEMAGAKVALIDNELVGSLSWRGVSTEP